MREIVHIQAGQCGNQIGAKVSLFIFLFQWNEILVFFFNSVVFDAPILYIAPARFSLPHLILFSCPHNLINVNLYCNVGKEFW